ncbi:hypothetical protein CWI38_0128p0050 [Hamiltosporidium tvaerminnensis]|uniref:Adenylate cyclase n=1 Tax=Hamiltosporidium tvaerminnensis TaxID=1176355 RepID=A0A4Q9M3N2_9MICR|nr:hypothetical protein CWI37_0980p0010 [Hamiltosporidium tvaerminnensis]TBU20126.1 hypothetical protein CWI38_0128p0050 [Hamiltosporidium tvaerminnensis]
MCKHVLELLRLKETITEESNSKTKYKMFSYCLEKLFIDSLNSPMVVKLHTLDPLINYKFTHLICVSTKDILESFQNKYSYLSMVYGESIYFYKNNDFPLIDFLKWKLQNSLTDTELSRNKYAYSKFIMFNYDEVEKLYSFLAEQTKVRITIDKIYFNINQDIVKVGNSNRFLVKNYDEKYLCLKNTCFSVKQFVFPLPNAFKNIEVLDLSGNFIKEIPRDFSEFRKINYLNLSHNLLENLPTFLSDFQFEELNLSNNRLSKIPFLNSKTLILDNNLIEYFQQRDSIFDKISLKSNPVKRFFSKAKYLDLSFTFIKNIHVTFGEDIVEHLILEGIKIDYFKGNFSNLKYLNMQNCNTSVFSIEAPHLSKLILRNNLLTEFPFFPNLEYLDLSGNLLTFIESKILNLKKLKILDISRNDIINPNAYDWKWLEKINILYNQNNTNNEVLDVIKLETYYMNERNCILKETSNKHINHSFEYVKNNNRYSIFLQGNSETVKLIENNFEKYFFEICLDKDFMINTKCFYNHIENILIKKCLDYNFNIVIIFVVNNCVRISKKGNFMVIFYDSMFFKALSSKNNQIKYNKEYCYIMNDTMINNTKIEYMRFETVTDYKILILNDHWRNIIFSKELKQINLCKNLSENISMIYNFLIYTYPLDKNKPDDIFIAMKTSSSPIIFKDVLFTAEPIIVYAYLDKVPGFFKSASLEFYSLCRFIQSYIVNINGRFGAIQIKYEGDLCICYFRNSLDAIMWSVNLDYFFSSKLWKDDFLKRNPNSITEHKLNDNFLVRIGICKDIGFFDRNIEGDVDWYGQVLNKSARLAKLNTDINILISENIYTEIVHLNLSQIEFKKYENYQLKGFTEMENVYGIVKINIKSWL